MKICVSDAAGVSSALAGSSEQVQDDLDSEAKKQVISPTVERFVELQADFHQQLAALRELTVNWKLEKDPSGTSNNSQVDLFSSSDSVKSRSVQMDEQLIPRIFQTVNLDKNNFTVKTQEQTNLAPLQQSKYSLSQSIPRRNPWQSIEKEDKELADDETRQSKTISPLAENFYQKEQFQSEINQVLLQQLQTLKALQENHEKQQVNSEASKALSENSNAPLLMKELNISDKQKATKALEVTTEQKLGTNLSAVKEIVLTEMVSSNNKIINAMDADESKEIPKPHENSSEGLEEIKKALQEGSEAFQSQNTPTENCNIPSSSDYVQLSMTNNNLTSNENPLNLEILESSQPASMEQLLLDMESLPEQLLIPLTAALKTLSPKKICIIDSELQEIEAANESIEQQIPDAQTKKNFKNKLENEDPLKTFTDDQESTLQNQTTDSNQVGKKVDNEVRAEELELENNVEPIVTNKNPEADFQIKILKEKRTVYPEIADQTNVKNINANQSKLPLLTHNTTESDLNSNKLVRTSFKFSTVEQHSQDSLLLNAEKNLRERQGNTESHTATLRLNQIPDSDQDDQNLNLKINQNVKIENTLVKKNLADQFNNLEKIDFNPEETVSTKTFETFNDHTQISIASSENLPENKVNANLSTTSTAESITFPTNCSSTRNLELSSNSTNSLINLTSVESKDLISNSSNEQFSSIKPKRRSSLFTVLSYFSGQNKLTSVTTTPTSETEKNFSSSLSVNIINKSENKMSISPNSIAFHKSSEVSKTDYENSSQKKFEESIRQKITDSMVEDIKQGTSAEEVHLSSLQNTMRENSSENQEQTIVTPFVEELNSIIIESDIPLQNNSNNNVAATVLIKVSGSPIATGNDSVSSANLMKTTSASKMAFQQNNKMHTKSSACVVKHNKIDKPRKIFQTPQQKKPDKILKSPSFYSSITKSRSNKARSRSPIKKVIGRRSPVKWLKKSISPRKYGIVRSKAPPRSLNKLPLPSQGERKVKDNISRIPVAEATKVINIHKKGNNQNIISQMDKKIERNRRPQHILNKKPNASGNVNTQIKNKGIELSPIIDSDESLVNFKRIFPSKIPVLKGSKLIPAQTVSVEIQRQIDPKLLKPSTIFPPSLSPKKMIKTEQFIDDKAPQMLIPKKEALTGAIKHFSIVDKQVNVYHEVIETNQDATNGNIQCTKSEDNSSQLESSSDSEYESIYEESISMNSKNKPQESQNWSENSKNDQKESTKYEEESHEESQEESQDESQEKSQNEFQEESQEQSQEESLEDSQENSQEESEEESQRYSQEDSSNDSLNSNESHDSLHILANADYLLEKTLNKIKAEISEYESEDKSDNENSEEITSESVSTKSGKSGRNGSVMETSVSSETQSETLIEHYAPLEENVEISAVTTAKLYLMQNIERKSEDTSKSFVAAVKENVAVKGKSGNTISIYDKNEKKEKPKKRYSMVASFVQQFEGKSPKITRRRKNPVKESKQRKNNSKESLINEREVSR